MNRLMRCLYCGLLQDEPAGVKQCARCGGELNFEHKPVSDFETYLNAQMELDQIAAPAGRNVDRYLMVTIKTPDEVPSGEAAPVGKKRPPMTFTAVLDVSGSMFGEKLVQVMEAVRQAVRYLHTGDVFSLATFATVAKILHEPAKINRRSVAAIDNLLKEINPGGMTALHGGLEKGIDRAAEARQENNLVLLLSDGQANVGETDLEIIGQTAARGRERGLVVSTLGVGSDYNEALMVEIANQGGGRFYHIEGAAQIPAVLMGELGEIAALAARNLKIHLEVPEGATLIPLSASYPIQQSGRDAVVSIGDIPCGIQLEIGLRLALLGQSRGSRLSVEGNLTFLSPAGHEMEQPINQVTVRFVEPASFPMREGLVADVAERVFSQMRATSVLGVSRLRAVRPDEVEQHTRGVIANLHRYAELLGEERAGKALQEAEQDLQSLSISPAAAKRTVSYAHRRIRSIKDYLE